MINSILIKEPNVDKWLKLVKDILDGKQDIDLNKLGGAGPFIKNIFLHTEPEMLSKSIEDFFSVFKSLLKKYNNTTFETTADEILFSLSIANTFSKKDKVKDYEKHLFEAGLKNTSAPFYFNQITLLVNSFVEDSEPNNLIDNQAVLYEYLLYLKRNYVNVMKDDYLDPPQLLSIKKILKAAVGINEKHASLASFLLYSLNKNESTSSENPAVTESIIQYCIASKNITNELLNSLILDFARVHNATFNSILDSFNCSLSSDGFTIVYEDQSYKDLEPGKEEWDYLNEIYNLNNTPVEEILHQHLARPISSN